MDWKEDFEEIAERQIFTIDGKKGTLKNTYIYESILSFIENLLEQEKKRMNDEIGKLENDAETVYNAGKCDYDNHVNKESVLSIVNKKCKFC